MVWHAARCVALVPQVGGGGTGGVQYKLAWASQQKQLCRTIHLILDDLYSDTNELQVCYKTFSEVFLIYKWLTRIYLLSGVFDGWYA